MESPFPFLRKQCSLKTLFPSLVFDHVVAPDMSVGSSFFGNDPQHEDLGAAEKRLDDFQKEHPSALLANGYLESRSFYNTKNYERATTQGKEFRNVHLGTDFWVPANTPLHAPLDGKVVISYNNAIHKDYGPLLVMEHQEQGFLFYTLYGHLTRPSLDFSFAGKKINKGELFGWIGLPEENGHWVPHLHFQVITDLLGNTENYPGVAYPSELELWKKRCPNPDDLFEEYLPKGITHVT